MSGSKAALASTVRTLLQRSYDADGRLPEALVEEDFLALSSAALSSSRPDAIECCEKILSRCMLDAVNEALEVLATPKPPPRGLSLGARGAQQPDGLALLVSSATERRTGSLGVDEAVAKVLALLPDLSDDVNLPDNIGAATRMLWRTLAPEWTDYGEDDWAAARAQLHRDPHRAEGGNGGEEDARAKLAAEIFWEGREALILDQDELHHDLWHSLCKFVSPPWPEEDAPPADDVTAPAAKDDGEGEDGGGEEGEEGEEGSTAGSTAAARGVHRINYDDYLLALSQLDAKKLAPLKV